VTRIPGEFVPLDVNAPHDRALRMAGPLAELLFYRGLMWSRKHKGGGFLADFNLAEIGAGIPSLKKYADALVRERLWLKVRGGWQIRSFPKWNPEPDLAAQSTGGRIGNHNRWHTEGRWSPDCEFCTAPPLDLDGIGSASVPRSLPDRYASQSKRESERETDGETSSSLLRYVPRETGATR
jgi:hypothetical protein